MPVPVPPFSSGGIQVKNGESIICTDDSMQMGVMALTKGKEYTLVSGEGQGLYLIVDDNGNEIRYGAYRFAPAMSYVPRMHRQVAKAMIAVLAMNLKMQIDILDHGPNYLMLRFVSMKFDGESMVRRVSLMEQAVQVWCKRVWETHQVLIEAYTPRELMTLEDII